MIEAEPALAVVVSGERFDAALEALADFADVKSPYFLGHSRAVSELAARGCAHPRTARRRGASPATRGLVHDLGRLGVSNAIWDKRGPLGAGERERVRMHPYLTERMLHASADARAAGARHRAARGAPGRLGLSARALGAAISRPARILAAANVYQAMCEPRPHRPERTAGEAAAELRAEASAGRLDPDATDAVLGAVGYRVPQRRGGPAGLTAREVEVLRLLARGLSNREIAARLVISPKTAGNHIEHIYAKIDASSRATASLFAMQHGLLPEVEVATPVAR